MLPNLVNVFKLNHDICISQSWQYRITTPMYLLLQLRWNRCLPNVYVLRPFEAKDPSNIFISVVSLLLAKHAPVSAMTLPGPTAMASTVAAGCCDGIAQA